jgi:hypothetical protein
LFDEFGFEQVEVVVGDSITGPKLVEQYRNTLRDRGDQTTRKVAELVASGQLRIYVPRRTIHSKLYLLTTQTGVRIIQGGANLTDTARHASRQVNYVWYADLQFSSPWLTQVRRTCRSWCSPTRMWCARWRWPART